MPFTESQLRERERYYLLFLLSQEGIVHTRNGKPIENCDTKELILELARKRSQKTNMSFSGAGQRVGRDISLPQSIPAPF